MDFERRILPFYMTYPGPCGAKQDDTIIRDLEYLNQTYPGAVKKYQKRIIEILDKMDYEGSMIYDEYPDRYSLQRLTKNIITIMQREEEECEPECPTSPEKWEWMVDMVHLLVCNEIYKRRHGGRRRFIKF
ncbi:hypothetical protein LJC58_04585 [Lachnospiraceae bacterium OttesenSCG-928-D06]|nr:hypothetical protein [Lachnospiraceae bacterium OttesenSCG-928-D06]